MSTVVAQILPRRGTAAAWTSANPILGAGEEGYETDSGKTKVGDATTHWVSLPYTNATLATETTARIAADALGVLRANNGSDFADAGATRATLHVPALTPAAVAAISNVTLSGLQTIDTYTLVAGDLVLLTGQVTGSQNGLWLAASGSWTRPTEFATGLTPKARTVVVIQGAVNGQTEWLMQTNTAVTVDTTAQTWVKIAGGSTGSGLAVLVAQPWVANQTYSTGQIVSQSGSIWSSKTNFTAGTTFNSANWNLGATAGAQVYEQNGSGQVVGIWLGNGLGTPATLILSVLTGGAVTPQGAWASGTAYSADAIVTRSGSSYIAISGSTGDDPATDGGVHWMLLAAPGPTGPTGATGSPTTDQSILGRYLADFARDPELMNGGGSAGTPTGPHIAQSVHRGLAITNTAITSGTLHMTLIAVPGGRTLTGASIKMSVAMSGGTHAWLGLWDPVAGTQLALSADDGLTSASASLRRDYTFATPYVMPTGGGFVAAGFLQVATTPGSIGGITAGIPTIEPPTLAGNYTTTGLTSPPSTATIALAKAQFWVSLW